MYNNFPSLLFFSFILSFSLNTLMVRLPVVIVQFHFYCVHLYLFLSFSRAYTYAMCVCVYLFCIFQTQHLLFVLCASSTVFDPYVHLLASMCLPRIHLQGIDVVRIFVVVKKQRKRKREEKAGKMEEWVSVHISLCLVLWIKTTDVNFNFSLHKYTYPHCTLHTHTHSLYTYPCLFTFPPCQFSLFLSLSFSLFSMRLAISRIFSLASTFR